MLERPRARKEPISKAKKSTNEDNRGRTTELVKNNKGLSSQTSSRASSKALSVSSKDGSEPKKEGKNKNEKKIEKKIIDLVEEGESSTSTEELKAELRKIPETKAKEFLEQLKKEEPQFQERRRQEHQDHHSP